MYSVVFFIRNLSIDVLRCHYLQDFDKNNQGECTNISNKTISVIINMYFDILLLDLIFSTTTSIKIYDLWHFYKMSILSLQVLLEVTWLLISLYGFVIHWTSSSGTIIHRLGLKVGHNDRRPEHINNPVLNIMTETNTVNEHLIKPQNYQLKRLIRLND